MPSSANQLERRVLTCASALDAPLRGFARKYSPPVLVVALVLQLNRLGRAHILAGLLTADQLRELVMSACDFASSTPSDSIDPKKSPPGRPVARFGSFRGPADRRPRQNTQTPKRLR